MRPVKAGVEVAECSGFCFGVKRAIRIAKEALEGNKDKNVYSLGPIIHNNQVVEELRREGLKPVEGLDKVKKGIIVISSHGADPEIFEKIRASGLGLVNATCPFVMSAQKIVKALKDDGYLVVILGDKKHPEVKALVGCAGGKAVVIKDEEELRKTRLPSDKIGLVSQTTQTLENYFKVISVVLESEFLGIRIFNTICSDTERRQRSAARLAKEVDSMIIVGGRMSANTKRLFEICSGLCKETYHIETAGELKKAWVKKKSRIGIASGASTPDWIIENVGNSIKRGI